MIARRLAIPLILLLLLAGLAAGGVLAWWVGSGLDRLDARIERLAWGRVALADLALDDTLTARRLAVDWDGLTVKKVAIAGLRLKGQLGDGPLFGPLDRWLFAGGGGGAGPLPEFDLDDVEIALGTEWGIQRIALSGRGQAIEALLSGPLAGRATVTLAGGAVALAAPALAIGAHDIALAGISLALSGGQGKAHAAMKVGETEIALDAVWQDQKGRTHLDLALRDLRARPAFRSLVLAGDVEAGRSGLRFQGELADRERTFVMSFAARHRADGTGDVRLTLDRLVFAPDGLQPEVLLPALAGMVERAKGAIGLIGRARWSKDGFEPRVTVRFDDLSATVNGIDLHRLNGVVTLTRLWPLETPPGQVLAMAGAVPGVPLADLELVFTLLGERGVSLEQGRMRLAGGRLDLRPTILSADGEGEVVIEAKGLDLGHFVELLGVRGLEADGTLDGRVPIRLAGQGAELAGGRLRAVHPGLVRYRPDPVPAALQGGGEGVSLMLAALADFHYEALDLALDGRTGRETTLGFHIRGRNPSLHDGYPFAFNLNLSGPLDRVVERAIAGWTIPERIEREMRTFSR